MLLNAPATILLVAVAGIVYLAANGKDVPTVLYSLVVILALTDGVRHYTAKRNPLMSIYDAPNHEQLVRIADALERIAAILTVQTRAQLSQSQGPAAASFGAADIQAEIAAALSPRPRPAGGGE